MRRLRALAYALARTGRSLRRRPLSAAMAAGAVGAALLLLGLVHLASRNLEAVTELWGGGVQMVVYLDDGTEEAQAGRIAEALRELPAVKTVTYVAPREAHERLAASLGEREEALLGGIEVGMLPASLEVTLGDGIADVAAAHPVVERLTATPGVEEVEFPGEWVDRFSGLLGGIRAAALALLVLVGGACVYVIAATVRLSLRERSREADVLRLLGASEGAVRLPVVLEGALQGAVGGLLAAAGLFALYKVFAGAVEAALAAAFGSAPIGFLGVAELALFVGLGAVLGAAAGSLGAAAGARHVAA